MQESWLERDVFYMTACNESCTFVDLDVTRYISSTSICSRLHVCEHMICRNFFILVGELTPNGFS